MAEATLCAERLECNRGKRKPKKFDIDPDWFRQKYEAEQTSVSDLAAMIGCNTEHIKFFVAKFGIPRRPIGSVRKPSPLKVVLDISEITRLYVDERMACNRIAERFGCDGGSVRKRLVAAGVKIRHHNDTKRGAKARNRIELDAAAVIEMYGRRYESGATVAKAFGVERCVIDRILRENGIPKKPMAETRNFWGENSPNWRHNITDEERAKRRDHNKQAAWRIQIYERDKYTCQKCGDADGGNLNAHHVEPHCRDKEKRWKIDNGVTLCVPCHRAFHSQYGLKRCNRADLVEYLAA
jgi:hypothetical protein